jgi:lipid-A-disaccharide synthase
VITLFLAAGEPSGDALGAALMRGLKQLTGGQVRFLGVGGPAMAAEGLDSLFPQDELAVMGLVEVLPRALSILRRIRQTADACLSARPAALITIDSPGFGLRVARRVRAADPAIRTIHYVAPSVWAWRPGRARKMAAYVDHVLALLPFEPPYFTAEGMTCDFVGHPAAARPRAPEAEIAALRAEAGAAPGQPLLLALPGSRMGEVKRHCAPMGQTLALLRDRFPDLRVVLPTVPGVAEAVAGLTADWPLRPLILDPRGAPQAQAEARKWAAFCASDAALAASGTVALELAAAQTPMVAIYRANALTAAIVRRLVRVNTANLVNLVAGEAVVPEFLQEHIRPEAVAQAVGALLTPGPARDRQRAAMARVVATLGGQGEPPSLRAARSVLNHVKNGA